MLSNQEFKEWSQDKLLYWICTCHVNEIWSKAGYGKLKVLNTIKSLYWIHISPLCAWCTFGIFLIFSKTAKFPIQFPWAMFPNKRKKAPKICLKYNGQYSTQSAILYICFDKWCATIIHGFQMTRYLLNLRIDFISIFMLRVWNVCWTWRRVEIG